MTVDPSLPPPATAVRFDGVTRTYRMGRRVEVHALRGIDLEIGAGEFWAILGPSGSGKTTLLNLLGLLDHPTTGEIELVGRPTSTLDEIERAQLRSQAIGFVFQSFNLLQHLTAEENVALPLRYTDHRGERTPAELLATVGLGDRRRHRPDELSGGEQQRVAIARSLLLDPAVLLADEPTGNLDSQTEADVMRLLREQVDRGTTLILVTHNQDLACDADRVVHLRDGLVDRIVRPADRPSLAGPPDESHAASERATTSAIVGSLRRLREVRRRSRTH